MEMTSMGEPAAWDMRSDTRQSRRKASTARSRKFMRQPQMVDETDRGTTTEPASAPRRGPCRAIVTGT
jgi:hypothetical protein